MIRIRRSPPWMSLALVMVAFGGASAETPDSQLDTLQQRVKPCTSCHGNEGRATREGYFPRIAGKPAGYLFNQLLNFREGRRHFPMMTYVAQYQTDDYLREIATWFGSQQVPYPPPMPTKAAPEVLARGHHLVTQGDKTLDIPACTSCHGKRAGGSDPRGARTPRRLPGLPDRAVGRVALRRARRGGRAGLHGRAGAQNAVADHWMPPPRGSHPRRGRGRKSPSNSRHRFRLRQHRTGTTDTMKKYLWGAVLVVLVLGGLWWRGTGATMKTVTRQRPWRRPVPNRSKTRPRAGYPG